MKLKINLHKPIWPTTAGHRTNNIPKRLRPVRFLHLAVAILLLASVVAGYIIYRTPKTEAALAVAQSNIAGGWRSGKQRNVFHNGSHYFVFYYNGSTSLYAKAATTISGLTAASEQTVLNGTMYGSGDWEIHAVSDTKLDIVYVGAGTGNGATLVVQTCVLASATVDCSMGSSRYLGSAAVTYTNVSIVRNSFSDRIYIAGMRSGALDLLSAGQAGDSSSVTSWNVEFTQTGSPVGNVTLAASTGSDAIHIIYARDPTGTTSDGIYHRAHGRGGSSTERTVASGAAALATATNFGNFVRVNANSYKFIYVDGSSPSQLIEANWDNAVWTNTVIDTAGGQKDPSILFDTITGDLYAFYADSSNTVQRYRKPSAGAWGEKTRVDLSESDANSLPVAQMLTVPLGSTRTTPRELVWGYRNLNGSNYDIVVGAETLVGSIATPVTNVAFGWDQGKSRHIFYNGDRFWMFYSKNDGVIYRRTSLDGVTWTAEASVLSGVKVGVPFDVYLVNDGKFDLAWINSTDTLFMATLTISASSLTNLGSVNLGSMVTPISVAVTRTPSADRIWVATTTGSSANTRLWSADQTGDSSSITTWTANITGNSDANVTGYLSLVPYDTSDKVLLMYMRNPNGTASDGIYSRAVQRGVAAGAATLIVNLPSVTTNMFGNAIRISDTDFRYTLVNTASPSQMVEYKWNNTSWAQEAVIDSGGSQKEPVQFYDNQTGDQYVFYADANDDIQRYYKPSGGAWGSKTRVDNSESTANSKVVVAMQDAPHGSTRNDPRYMVWAYRTANGANYDLKVGTKKLSPTYNQDSYRWFSNTDAVQPGSSLGHEDAFTVFTADPAIRLRIGVGVLDNTLPAGFASFKLQYATSTGGAWTDVGTGSWTFHNNATPADKATLSSALLTGSMVAQTYHETNPTGNNTSSVNANQAAEYDFALDASAAVAGQTYYFRLVKANDTTLTTYTVYPKLTVIYPQNYLRSGQLFTEQSPRSYCAGGYCQ